MVKPPVACEHAAGAVKVVVMAKADTANAGDAADSIDASLAAAVDMTADFASRLCFRQRRYSSLLAS
jgi:hypothetical protein